VLLSDGTAWEVRTGCVYTHSGTSLARGTLEDSSTGSAISLTSATIVTVTATAGFGNRIEALLQATIPGGRLTLTTGVPMTSSDVTGATTIYYTPYVHNCVCLWDGARWVPTSFTEVSLALGTVTSGRPYDVFGYLSSGVLALELLSWTNDSTRATAVTRQDGRLCKSGDKTRLLLGTIRTTSTTATEDSIAKRFVWNVYNQVPRTLQKLGSGSWSYSTNTWRQANADSANQVEIVVGQDTLLKVTAFHLAGGNSGVGIRCGIGEDSTSATASESIGRQTNLPSGAGGDFRQITCALVKQAVTGYHKYCWLEASDVGGSNTAWYGSTTPEPGSTQGLFGEVLA
jgi:hypothetical protein